MNKKILILLIILLMSCLVVENVSATTIFLTSDNLSGDDSDLKILESIKNYIEDLSNGKITVIIDSKAPSPGEGTRAIESNADVRVTLACADAGNFRILAKNTVATSKPIIFVNMGDFDLIKADFIRRSWDDNYSNENFAGIKNPGTFLIDSGVKIIQPAVKFPDCASDGVIVESNDKVNKYIAEEIIKSVNSDSGDNNYDSNLVALHNISPKIMAESSQALIDNPENMESTYNSFSAPQLLYLTSSYITGSALKTPKHYEAPSSPLEYSSSSENSYSFYDYMEMAILVKNYMDDTGSAPDYIEYEGAKISYYDLVYNFALITKDHTDSSHMNFNKSYEFKTFHESILINVLPFAAILLVLVLIFYGINRSRKKRRKRPPRLR